MLALFLPLFNNSLHCAILRLRSRVYVRPSPAGDLLRAEQARPDSSVGKMIKEYITEGKIVPMEVTIKLLENAMREAMQSGGQSGKEASTRFLVDGFPRQMDQAVKFDESVRFVLSSAFSPSRPPPTMVSFPRPSPALTSARLGAQVCPSSLVLFLVCPEHILLERLLERGKTSGRDDDNAESIKKRFRGSLPILLVPRPWMQRADPRPLPDETETFINTSMPVVEYYKKQGKVVEVRPSPSSPFLWSCPWTRTDSTTNVQIDSSKSIEDVYADIVKGVEPVVGAVKA